MWHFKCALTDDNTLVYFMYKVVLKIRDKNARLNQRKSVLNNKFIKSD